MAYHSIYTGPAPAPADAPPADFSEARAMAHTRFLSKLEDRQVCQAIPFLVLPVPAGQRPVQG